MERVGAPGVAARVEPLQPPLGLCERVGIEQLPQLGVAHELAKLGLVDHKRLCAALGEWCIAVVEEARHVAEEQ